MPSRTSPGRFSCLPTRLALRKDGDSKKGKTNDYTCSNVLADKAG